MNFKNEVGAIIASDEGLISMFDGEPGPVDFPDELIQKIHRLNPGYINRFTHTHPPGVNKPSERDNKMMTNLAFSLYPFPVRLGIIIPDKGSVEDSYYSYGKHHEFVEYIYQWVLEPKEVWEERKIAQDDVERNIVFECVGSKIIVYKQHQLTRYLKSWEDWIIKRSYSV